MKPQHTLFALVIACVWGLNFIASKWAVEDFPPLFANGLRFAVVLLVLFPFLRIVPGKMRPLITTAITLGVVHFGLLFFGMSLADGVGSVAIASQLNVPFTTILGIVILKETVGLPRIAGISISFVGVMFLGFDPIIFAYWNGLLVIVSAAFIYAVCAVMMRQLIDVPATTIQAWVALAGMSGSFAVSIVFEGGQLASLSSAGNLAWMSIAYSALISTLIGHGGANYLFQRYEVSMVSPYFLTLPFFSVAGGVVLMGETVGWQMIVGGTITILGVLIVTLRNDKRAQSHKVVQSHD